MIQSSTEYSDEYGGRKVHSPFRRPTGSSSFDKSFYKPTEKQVRKSDIYCVNTGVRMRQPIVHKKIDTVHHHHDMYRGLGNSNVKLNLPPNNRYQWLEHISNPQARQTFSHKDKNAEH